VTQVPGRFAVGEPAGEAAVGAGTGATSSFEGGCRGRTRAASCGVWWGDCGPAHLSIDGRLVRPLGFNSARRCRGDVRDQGTGPAEPVAQPEVARATDVALGLVARRRAAAGPGERSRRRRMSLSGRNVAVDRRPSPSTCGREHGARGAREAMRTHRARTLHQSPLSRAAGPFFASETHGLKSDRPIDHDERGRNGEQS